MKTTQQILADQRRSGIHPCEASEEGWISTATRWDDDLWILDGPSRRTDPARLRMPWKDFPRRQVPLFKELLWSLFVSRPDDHPVSVVSAGSTFYSLRFFARWMEKNKRWSFASITPAYVDSYRSHVKDHLKQRATERQTDCDTAAVFKYIIPIHRAFEQRRALEARGHAGLDFEPYGEAAPWTVAAELVPYEESFTPPLPDEVALPIVQQAHAFIHEPADDLIELLNALSVLRGRLNTKHRSSKQADKLFDRFRRRAIRSAASAARDDQPWLRELKRESLVKADYEFEAPALRRLMFDVLGACVIYLRFQTGIRHGEILTLQPGLDAYGIPTCVETEDSVSGAYDLFFIKGLLEKGRQEPEDVRWLLAGRVKGDDRLPDVVRALQVIDRIMAPWREMSSDPDALKYLLVQFSTAGFPRDGSSIQPMHSTRLATLMHDFIEHRVDLSHLDETDEKLSEYVKHKGRNVQSRQWRKTWANFVFRTNKKLLPAISQQFQHLSISLTQEAYIGKDPEQLGLVENAATQRAIGYIGSVMDGDEGVGGIMRKVVDGLDDLKEHCAGLTGDDRDEQIRTWLVERDVRCWSAPHGKCFVGLFPEGSRCHAAGGTMDWSNQAPNFLTRSPRLCSGCACFGADQDDVPFWAERYFSNKQIWEDAVSLYMESHYVVARERYEQSERVLRSLHVNVQDLGEEYRNAAANFS